MANPASDRWATIGTGLTVGAAVGFMGRDLDLPAIVSFWGDRTPLIAVASVLGAILWHTRLRRAVAAVALGLGTLWTAVAVARPISARLADGLTRHGPEGAADAVFVLASGLQADGDLTAAAMSRLVHALELIGQGRTKRLILSELPPPHRAQAVVARPMMERIGLQAEVVTVGPVRNTRDEAVAVGALCRERGWMRLLVVTSPLHTLRASAALEHEGVTVVSSPAVETRCDVETLDRADDRLFVFGAALHERVGVWLYGRRGWLATPSR